MSSNSVFNAWHNPGCPYDNEYSLDIHWCDCSEAMSVTSMNEDLESSSESDSVFDEVSESGTETVHRIAMRTLTPGEEALRFFVFGSENPPSYSSVGFICQGNTTLLECRAQAEHIYSLSEDAIDVIYNGAYSGWSSRHIASGDSRVILLRMSWDAFFSVNTNPMMCRLQFCAGDSVFIVRRALEDYPHRNRIMIVAVSPSCELPSNSCWMVRYYHASGDLLSANLSEDDDSDNVVESSLIPRNAIGGLGDNRGILNESNRIVVRRRVALSASVRVSRNPESRGFCDCGIQSSTFQSILHMEASCFALRQRLLLERRLSPDFDRRWQKLRDEFVLTSERTIHGGYRPIPTNEIESRRRHLLADFFGEFPSEVTSLNNLYEAALDEYPRNLRERHLVVLDMLTNGMLFISVVATGRLRGLRWVVAAVPFIELGNLMRRSGVYIVRRDQEQGHILRQIALTTGLLDLACWLYEAGVLGTIAVAPGTPQFITLGLGCHLIFTGANLLAENLIRFGLPLRDRIQVGVSPIATGDIRTERNRNESATQMGLIQRICRASSQIGRGLGILAVSGVFLSSLVFSSESGSVMNTLPSLNDSLGNETLSGPVTSPTETVCLFGITGFFAVAGVIANVIQIRDLVRRFRNRHDARDTILSSDALTEVLAPNDDG